jgi:hypothetical protein
MKKLAAAVILVVLATLPSQAGTAEAYAIGFGAGIAFKLIPLTNHKIVMPMTRAVQRTIRPIPQDKVDAANRKAEKARHKAAKQRHEQP